MAIVYRAVTGAFFVLFVVTAAIAEQPTSVAKKVALQAAMQRHIESQLIDGAYLHLDPGSGAVRALYPVKAHPMTLKMGDYFVLCSDFRDTKGRAVNVDFNVGALYAPMTANITLEHVLLNAGTPSSI